MLDDVAVPRSQLVEAIARIEQVAADRDVVIGTFGHAGDGNLHPTVVHPHGDAAAAARAALAFEDIVARRAAARRHHHGRARGRGAQGGPARRGARPRRPQPAHRRQGRPRPARHPQPGQGAPPECRMRIALFATCLADTLYPSVATATVDPARAARPRGGLPRGADVLRADARQHRLPARGRSRSWRTTSRCSSRTTRWSRRPGRAPAACGTSTRWSRERYGPPGLADRARAVAARTYELSELLVDVLGVEDVGAAYPHRVTYHPTCHSLRHARRRRQAAAAAPQRQGPGPRRAARRRRSAAASAARSR